MRKFWMVVEYIVAGLFVVGGIQTLAAAFLTDVPISPVIVVMFGFAFLVGGVLNIFGKLSGRQDLRVAGLQIMFLSTFFGFVLEVTALNEHYNWVDTLVFTLITAYLRIRASLERPWQDTQIHSTESEQEHSSSTETSSTPERP